MTKKLVLIFCLVFSLSAWAGSDLDRQFALESVGYLKSWDNVDGIFADFVDRAYRDYFLTHPKRSLQDLSRANEILSASKLSYSKVIEDNDILGKLAKSVSVESILRTRINKEGPRYRFEVEWLHSPRMEVMATQNFEILEPPPGEKMKPETMREGLEKALDALFSKIPFQGQVNGRDEKTITVNMGRKAGIRKGDTLTIATLDEAKKHPLLNKIVDWKLTPMGKAVVEEVDENLSFARVIEEADGRAIGKYQKIVAVTPAPENLDGKPNPATQSGSWVPAGDVPSVEKPEAPRNMPRYGWAAATPFLGEIAREYTASAGTTGFKGSGLLYGAKIDANLWFTKNFFADGNVGFAGGTFKPTDLVTGLLATTANSIFAFSFRIAAGYTFLLTKEVLGPRGWLKLGFKRYSYGMTLSTTDLTGTTAWNTFMLGLGGDVPIRSGFGVQLDFNIGVIHIVSHPEELVAGAASGPSGITFYGGAYYTLMPKLLVRAGVDFVLHGTSFASGASLGYRMISFSPSILYYF